jgi:hypothetical protein
VTQLEQAALLLAAEVEQCIRLGVPMTTACINALDSFRKKQLTQGSQLDSMIKTVQQMERQECEVIRLHRLRLVEKDKKDV